MVVFLFLVAALVVVVAAVTLAAVGGGEGAALPEAAPEQWTDPLPWDRPLRRDDVDALRLPTALRGYRMAEVDEALGRLGAELEERDARIAHLEAMLRPAAAPAPPPSATGGYSPPAPDYPTSTQGGYYPNGDAQREDR
jgi:DivIVA domain-containing protein